MTDIKMVNPACTFASMQSGRCIHKLDHGKGTNLTKADANAAQSLHAQLQGFHLTQSDADSAITFDSCPISKSGTGMHA